MKTNTMINQETYASVEDYEAKCYMFFPSISRHVTVGGKSYYVRRYFKGDKDFERTMENLAVQNTLRS